MQQLLDSWCDLSERIQHFDVQPSSSTDLKFIKSVSSENLEIVETEYEAGKATFERGLYRQSVQHLEKASALVNRTSPLGGEVQMWLVTAYEAADQRPEAIALCQQLTRHPDWQTRTQSKRLLYILEAPKLNTRPEWLTQIPDLVDLAEGDPKDRRGSAGTSPPRSSRKTAAAEEPESPFNLSQASSRNENFFWVALGLMALILGSLWWFS
jgi:hypothetical protein